ncbi:MAG: NAD(P)H-quinone oxidoreductase [Acidobacteria bacterium]|nr:NAD(P)H-quinone oxidoreductase [Acidobacteriota bacterium]
MKAIVVREGNLLWEETPDVTTGPEEVVVRVRAAGVNRADLLQARGAYPPPPGASRILGLEIAGEANGMRVCSLLPGGGYAEKATAHRQMLMPLPEHWSFAQGAAVPEAWFTAFVNLFLEGGLRKGEAVLIHAGASGVGTAAIQLARDAGALVLVTVGSAEKAARCRELGADIIIHYREQDFAARALEATENRGVDLILDCVGGSYLAANLEALARLGRLVNIGLLGGPKAELNLGAVLMKRLRIIGSTLRSRPRDEHIAITREFRERYWDKLVSGAFKIVLDRTFPVAEAGQAHQYMAENRNIGKVVLEIP